MASVTSVVERFHRAAIALSIAAATLALAPQPSLDPGQETQLRQLFPNAVGFGPKSGTPPHFTAFERDASSSQTTPAGFAFWTTELAPLERGYDGPIKILVGMTIRGILTGVIVVDHHEPYGYFSVDRPEFAQQFKGKNIRDPFRLGGDGDAVSRATMTVGSATRAIRDSARRVARLLNANRTGTP